MLYLIPLLAVPLFIMAGFKLSNNGEFTVPEFFALEIPMVLLLVLGFNLAKCSAMQDTEIWSGRISSKDHWDESCSHSYSCNCRCVSRDKKGNCSSKTCDTCYRHNRDYYWRLKVSTGDNLMIESCGDCPYRKVPVWENAYVGEPAAVPHSYTNYLKADPDSVVVKHSSIKSYDLPTYPKVYSRYKIRRVIDQGTKIPLETWTKAIDQLNANMGHSKQVNILVVATKSPDPKWADALEEKWLYGKKNDLIFVFGAPDGETIDWARVVTISRVEDLKIIVRDEFPGHNLKEVDVLSSKIQEIVADKFHRTPMKEWEYLASAAKPSFFATFMLYLLAIIGSIVGSIVMINTDPFKSKNNYHRF